MRKTTTFNAVRKLEPIMVCILHLSRATASTTKHASPIADEFTYFCGDMRQDMEMGEISYLSEKYASDMEIPDA